MSTSAVPARPATSKVVPSAAPAGSPTVEPGAVDVAEERFARYREDVADARARWSSPAQPSIAGT